jgi:drug/metabolite transporter (DMT)-like permease
MIVLPVIYGLGAALFWGTGDFYSRIPSQKIGYYLTSTFVQLFGFLGLAAYLAATGEMNFQLLSANPYPLFYNLLVGVAMFAGLLFLYRGYATGIMSITAPVAGSYPVITIVLAALVLGEVVSGAKLVGIVIVIVGIVLAGIKLSELKALGFSTPKKDPYPANHYSSGKTVQKSKKIAEGLDSALGACFSLGIVYFLLGFVIPVFGELLPIMVMRGAAAATSIALFIPLRQKIKRPSLRTFLSIILLSILDTLGFVSIAFGVTSAGNSLPIVVTISGLVGVVTVLLASIFYHERLDKIQYLGLLVIFLGVATVLYS